MKNTKRVKVNLAICDKKIHYKIFDENSITNYYEVSSQHFVTERRSLVFIVENFVNKTFVKKNIGHKCITFYGRLLIFLH